MPQCRLPPAKEASKEPDDGCPDPQVPDLPCVDAADSCCGVVSQASQPDRDPAFGTDFAPDTRWADDHALRANGAFAASTGHPRRLLSVLVAEVQAILAC